MIQYCPPYPSTLPTICSCACQPVAFGQGAQPHLPPPYQKPPTLQPSSSPGSLFSRVPCAHVTLTLCQMPSAFPPPMRLETFCSLFSDGSKETSVLLKHLFTPLKTYHSNIMASLFVILPIRLQIPRRKGPGFLSFPTASVIAAKHDSQ